MSGKSNSRHIFQDLCSSAYHLKELITESKVVCEDTLQALKPMAGIDRFNPANEQCILKSGRDLVDRIKRSFEKSHTKYEDIQQGYGPKYYVMHFDKSRFVPMTKGVEQCRRDEQKKRNEENGVKKKEENADYKKRRPYLFLDKPLPSDFGNALSDRDDTQVEIINFICFQLLNNRNDCHAIVPQGKYLVIEGHCLTLEQCKKLGVGLGQNWCPENDEEAYCTPIIISYEEKKWAKFLQNEIGETDFSCFYIYDKICQHEEASRLGLDIFQMIQI